MLTRYDPAPRIAEYAERSGLTPTEVRKRLWESDFSNDCDRGVYSGDQMQTEICARLGTDFTRAELLGLQAAAFSVEPRVLAMADELSKRVRTGMLTNNSPLLEEAFPQHFAALCERLDPRLFSYRFASMKPDDELFTRVAAHLSIPPAEIFFIDDQQRHVDSARRAGWQAVRFASEEELRSELLDRGLLDASIY